MKRSCEDPCEGASPSKMFAAVFRQPGRVDLEEYDVPTPGAGEVLVRVEACGVCGTDFHIFRGEAPACPPVILGHEYCGEVALVGRLESIVVV